MKKNLIIVLIIIVLILLGSFLYIKYNTSINKIDNTDNEFLVVTSNLNTTDWQEYNNNNLGYSLLIPTSYKNKSVYEDKFLPLDPNIAELNLVNDNSSIRVSIEDRVLFPEEGDLDSILIERAKKYGYKLYKINGIIFYENPNFPEGGKTFSIAIGEKIVNFSFRNVEDATINSFLLNFKIL